MPSTHAREIWIQNKGPLKTNFQTPDIMSMDHHIPSGIHTVQVAKQSSGQSGTRERATADRGDTISPAQTTIREQEGES